MQEEKNKSHKPNLGDIPHKHAEKYNGIKKDKRRAMMDAKRRGKEPAIPCTDIIGLINTFPLERFLNDREPVNICKTLLNILKTENIQYYYAPSEIYPEHIEGPFLFGTPHVLRHLVTLLKTSQHVELLQCISHIMILISAHPEPQAWCPRLIGLGILDDIMKLINVCPDRLIRENLIWTLSNIALDNIVARKKVFSYGVAGICKNLEQCKYACGLYFYAVAQDADFTVMEPLWNAFINIIVRQHEPDETYARILCTIYRLVNMHDDDRYRRSLCSNGSIITRLMDPLDKECIVSASIMCCLTLTQDLYFDLITKHNVIPYFVACLNNINPGIRIQGIDALACLVTSKHAIATLLSNDYYMDSIQNHFDHSQIHEIQVTLKRFIANLIITIDDMGMANMYFPRFFGRESIWIIKLIGLLEEKLDFNALTLGLIAIQKLVRYRRDTMYDHLEDYGALDTLDRISMHCPNKSIGDLAEKILLKK